MPAGCDRVTKVFSENFHFSVRVGADNDVTDVTEVLSEILHSNHDSFRGTQTCMKYKFENCTLDVERRELHRDGTLQPVEPQVLDLLYFLIKNCDRIVSRENIFQAVWRGRIVSEAVLGTRINAARIAIGAVRSRAMGFKLDSSLQ